MENLDKLTKTGISIYDLNSENVSAKDFAETPLGPREKWPVALRCLVHSCVLPIPHAAAIFWGSELVIVHNLAWGKASGNLDGQGCKAYGSYSDAALSSLKTAIRGRTVKVASRFFFEESPDNSPNSQLLLSTILDEDGKRQGVLAQYVNDVSAEKYMSISGFDKLAGDHPAHRTQKDMPSQQSHVPGKTQAVDSKQTRLFQLFAELLPNGLAILDAGCDAIFVNDGFFKLTTNKSKQDFRAWPESIHPEDYDHVMDAYRKAFSTREELRVEFRCAADSSGEEGDWRLFLFKPLSNEPEAGYICAVIDITEIKQAQITQEKAATEAHERKEQQERFVDMVSHEIRNPLSAVLHLAEEVKGVSHELYQEHEDLRERFSEILDAADTILLCVSHQNTLVDDILSFSKLDSMMLTLVPREVRPKWEFATALKVFNSEFKAKNIQYHYAMDTSFNDAGVDYVIADINRMKQVLVNLITNAIKFTARKNGERRIAVSMGASLERPSSYPPNVIFFTQEDCETTFHIDSTLSSDLRAAPVVYLMVAVKDTGIGISEEDQKRLFERFRQATPRTQEKYGGSGLGLFIARKLCQLHGGDIGVASEDGEGSTFGFFFKARYTKCAYEGSRPSVGSRSSSGSPRPTTSMPGPSYSVANSALPGLHQLSPREGVSAEDIDASLKNPPIERITAAGLDNNNKDNPNEQTREVVGEADTNEHVEVRKGQLPDRTKSESDRLRSTAEDRSKSSNKEHSDVKETLLLVEDNLINQKVLRRQLHAKGFEVFVASNGQEAVDAVVERGKIDSNFQGEGSSRNYFDCILMDQEMPVKDGNTATQEIRKLQAEGKAGGSPILGVSANVREAQTSSMMEAGMDAVISKPFKVDSLVEKIRGLIPKAGEGQGEEEVKGKGKEKRDDGGNEA
ncbi:two component histidine kinase 1 [Byssothecium circinans]|uniref:Two component histidine kinase 1 n=1 Tax=Byssothecium circinans TaxID=147558 RepID=A0A6A5TN80_9PLEO|nr:two component histidine kinase 1 [Byssothecium circinans]